MHCESLADVHVNVDVQLSTARHVEHFVSTVPVQAVLTNVPGMHVVHDLQTVSLVAVHAELAYSSASHAEQEEQTVSAVGVHAAVAYWPAPQLLHEGHVSAVLFAR